MYDVLNFGCIPVVLSDDIVWAYSDQTGGPLNHSLYSIQLPQSIIYYNTKKVLSIYQSKKLEMGVLPSGQLLYSLLEKSYYHHYRGDYSNDGMFINPLIHILQQISIEDIQMLRYYIYTAAPYYRYYQMNQSMTQLPLINHQYPNGDSIYILTQLLSSRKKKGLYDISQQCQIERKIMKHNYMSRYTCDIKYKADSLV